MELLEVNALARLQTSRDEAANVQIANQNYGAGQVKAGLEFLSSIGKERGR
jgi:hypothetical protein